MEEIRALLREHLTDLGLQSSDVKYLKCGLERYVFAYSDSLGYPRYRKIIMDSDDRYGGNEGAKTASWLSFLGINNYQVQIEIGYQIVDTPFMGHDLYDLKIGKNFQIPFQNEHYPFNGFDSSEIQAWLRELENELIEFQRLTGLVHTDLFATGRPNNIVWNPYYPDLPALNVIDYESFQYADDQNLAKFRGRWDTAKDYILRNLVLKGSYS